MAPKTRSGPNHSQNLDSIPRPFISATSLPDSGDVRVEACGVLIDRVVWTDLPDSGTYALGLAPPDATGNDTAGNWCTDATDDTDPTTIGLPGTPGESNHPCP